VPDDEFNIIAPEITANDRLMDLDHTTIHARDSEIVVPCTRINNRTVIVTGHLLRIAAIQDESYVEGEIAPQPDVFVKRLRDCPLRPDIFTFSQKITEGIPRFPYYFEWDSFAVIPITSYNEWFHRRARSDVRQSIRKAKRAGVVTRSLQYNDEFLRGIKALYDDSPIRQAMRCWHSGKTVGYLDRIHGTYRSRSEYIGAYLNDELIGFVKMVYVDRIAKTMNVIGKQSYSHVRPTSALIAKAVRICEQKKISHFVYGQYRYPGKPNSSLAEFKQRNGFEEAPFPRYFVPLTQKGSVALRLGLHHELRAKMPMPVGQAFLACRSRFYKLLGFDRRGVHA